MFLIDIYALSIAKNIFPAVGKQYKYVKIYYNSV